MNGGFIPTGYVSLPDYMRDFSASIDDVGGRLAAGQLKAFEFHKGRLFALSQQLWSGPDGRRILEDGCMVGLRIGGKIRTSRPIVIRVSTEDAAKPEWWPMPDEPLSGWLSRETVLAEADRRVRARGGLLSEGRRDEALEAMWTEAGRKVAEGSVGRLRRRRRSIH